MGYDFTLIDNLISDWSMLYIQINFSWSRIIFLPRTTFSSKGFGKKHLPNVDKWETSCQIWSLNKILHIQLIHIRPSHSFLLSACVSNTCVSPHLSTMFILLCSKAYWYSFRWHYQWDMLPPLILLISLPRKFFLQIPHGSFPPCLPSTVFWDYSV